MIFLYWDAVVLYLCFSLIKSTRYWNSEAVWSIVEHGTKFYSSLNTSTEQPTNHRFPNTIQICDTHIDITLGIQGVLNCTSLGSKIMLQKLITDNSNNNTGFLMWSKVVFPQQCKKAKNSVLMEIR